MILFINLIKIMEELLKDPKKYYNEIINHEDYLMGFNSIIIINIKTFTDLELHNIIRYFKLKLSSMNVIIDELIERKSIILFDVFKEMGISQTYYIIFKLLLIDYEKTMKNIYLPLITDDIKNNNINEKDLKLVKIFEAYPETINEVKNPSISDIITTLSYINGKDGEWELPYIYGLKNIVKQIKNPELFDYLFHNNSSLIYYIPKKFIERNTIIKMIKEKVLNNVDELPKKFKTDEELLTLFE